MEQPATNSVLNTSSKPGNHGNTIEAKKAGTAKRRLYLNNCVHCLISRSRLCCHRVEVVATRHIVVCDYAASDIQDIDRNRDNKHVQREIERN